MSSIRTFFVSAAASLALVVPALAQNPFSAIARVNEAVVTEFEVQQRSRFLQLLNAPGASRSASLESLIEDRLRLQAVRAVGLEISQEGLDQALSEFASRAQLSTEEFVKALEGAGVAAETFRDFVAVQVAWRDLIRAQFGARVQITETDVDRALNAGSRGAGIRVLLSEIIIPAPAPRRAQALAQAAEISEVTTEAAFSSFARRFSATASRGAGGRLNWVPLTNLPPAIRPLILGLAPGQVTDPIPLPDGVALFQLRDIEETGRSQIEFSAIEYAAYYIAGGRSPENLARAERIKDSIDVCDDLYGTAKGQPPEVLERGALPPAEVPQDIALELAKLDPGEVSTNLTRADGQTLVFLMLCGRTPGEEETLDRSAIRQQLEQQRFQGFADALLEDLRAGARIEVLTQ